MRGIFANILGPILGLPVMDVRVNVRSVAMGPVTSVASLSACVSSTLSKVSDKNKQANKKNILSHSVSDWLKWL